MVTKVAEPNRTVRRQAARIGYRLLDRPVLAILPLGGIALGIEFAQYVPEVVPGAHALSEFVRNVSYGLIGALVFAWLVVEIPERRRRRSAYEYNKVALETLLTTGPASLILYRHLHPAGPDAVDIWDQSSVGAAARAIASQSPRYFGPDRAQLMRVCVLGVQTALDGLRPAQMLLDTEVAHALALFPAATGINQLQVKVDDQGNANPRRDAHIVWELSEASRRLYAALRTSVPEMHFNLGQMALTDGTVLEVREADLVRT